MLSAPEAPAPTEMQSSEVKASTEWKCRARLPTTSAVEDASNITRGFRSAMQIADISLRCRAPFDGTVLDD